MRRARGIAVLLATLAGLSAGGAAAQGIVRSAGPDAVAVTVYRDPQRNLARAPDLRWLNGYALISETRRITLPAGESTVRFEGVAGGIVPQSAIVTGFPEGIVERNRDAYLLSPATLIDRSLGQRVHLRRTSLATGEVREHEAVIRSGAGGALVLQTREGYEALRCTGLAETIVHDGVPPELDATPTLSVRTRSARPVTAEVTLSYLASGFDWQANYIAYLSDDGARADLFAWLTLASTDETSFPNADAQAVAGNINRRAVRPEPREGGPIRLQCWPQGTTSDIEQEDAEQIIVTGSRIGRMAPPPPPPPPPSPPPPPAPAMEAVQEDLGDLKLYRIPEPVTVAANSQKQVSLLSRPDVRVELVHRLRLAPAAPLDPTAAARFLVTRNRPREGLGLPLPAGGVVLFAEHRGRPLLIGEGFVADRAVGEDVEVALGEADGVTARVELVRKAAGAEEYLLMVSNDLRRPVRFEAEFEAADASFRPRRRLARRDGRPLWAVTVPAHGTAALRYRVVRAD